MAADAPSRPAVSLDNIATWRTKARLALRRCSRLRQVKPLLAQVEAAPNRVAELETWQCLAALAEQVAEWGHDHVDVYIAPVGVVLLRLGPGSGTVWHTGPAIASWHILIRLGIIGVDDGIEFLRVGPDGDVVETVSRRDLP